MTLVRGAVLVEGLVPQNQRSALERAAACGHLEVARLLLSHGADIEARDIVRLRPHRSHTAGALADAVAQRAVGHLPECRATASRATSPLAPCARGHPSQFGQTPLVLAANKGHLSIAELLLDAGADVNAKSKVRKGPQRPLRALCSCGPGLALRRR